jgi:hypothetical protein
MSDVRTRLSGWSFPLLLGFRTQPVSHQVLMRHADVSDKPRVGREARRRCRVPTSAVHVHVRMTDARAPFQLRCTPRAPTASRPPSTTNATYRAYIYDSPHVSPSRYTPRRLIQPCAHFPRFPWLSPPRRRVQSSQTCQACRGGAWQREDRIRNPHPSPCPFVGSVCRVNPWVRVRASSRYQG